jgi:signal transduction histidine kinase/ligand-binding sensor domain-containing protein/DNA-binding response OmpR family regulator
LSDNWIKCIYRDSRGFIWFGTNSGLNRFDGYNFEIFRHSVFDSSSIADNAINVISEDVKGNLWIGTRSGISILDNETFKFSTVTLVPSPRFLCQDIAYITAMASDKSGNILVGTHNGVFFFRQGSRSARHILMDEQSCISGTNNITAITSDDSGSFWVGTNNGFIFRLSLETNSVEKFESFREPGESSGLISNLFVDRNQNLWVGDVNGVCLFNIKTKSWNSDFQSKAGSVFRRLQIKGIDQDNDGKIWISTDGRGLFLVDPSDYSLIGVTSLPYVSGSLSSNGVNSLLCDNSGIIWIGTSKKGVDFYKKDIRKFRLYRNYPNDNNSLVYNDVDCIAEDYKGNLWIGTNGGGLCYFDRRRNEFTARIPDRDKRYSLSSKIIVSLFEDFEKKIWIGTYLGGLNCFDPKSGKLTVFRHSDSDSTSLSDDRIWSICEDSKKNLWIATLTNGLNRFDRTTGKFIRYNTQNSPICFNYLNSISVDKNDNLWISSANGLIFFNPSLDQGGCYFNNPADSTSLSDNHVVSTFEDSRGLFWVCTNNGLNLMDRTTGRFRVFNESDGLPSSSVQRILEDTNSDLWISTKNGITKMIVGKSINNSRLNIRFTSYGIKDGLQGKEFTETAALATRDGELWFGGTDGLNAFYPLEIRDDSSASKLVFSGLRIFNQKIKYGEKINKRVLLEKPIFNSSIITLKYKENSFTVDFVVLNYFNPDRNKYLYQLEGFNDRWISTEGKENFATFSNLNNGNYTLKVKAANSDGVWRNDPIELRIKVLPPFWKSWYAYTLYVIIILSLLAFLRYLILYRERLNIRIEQEQIESQYVHELDSLKIRFITNISHEFRTPLTLILAPVEKLLNQLKGKPEEKHLMLIQRNARRLLLMVNQLLDFRRMESQGFGYNPTYGNIAAFLGEVVASFNDLSEQKQIILIFNSGIQELNAWFDKDKIEKIIFNLLSNSFKFTHSGGTVKVSLIFEKTDTSDNTGSNNPRLIIKVEDTGIGIPADKVENLFNYFYQVESLLDYQGTGLGLALVKEFVKLHDGEIKAESTPGKGSCFTIILPLITGMAVSDKPERQTIKTETAQPLVLKEAFQVQNLEKKNRIVIAEDNDDLRFYIKDNLQNRYDVFEASNGAEALAIIKKIVPDLIISDIVMPVMDGKELCRKVKSDKILRQIPLIIITAHFGEKEQFETLEIGADDFIPKPFSFQILESKINNFLNLSRNLKLSGSRNHKVEPDEIDIVSLDEQFLQKAHLMVEKNMSKVDYTVEELSSDLGISRSLFYKKILSLTGKPPLEYIRTLRMKRAAQLLQKSQLNISEIAFIVGYNDPKYFRKHFKNEFGILPSRYSEESRSHGQQ